MTAPAPAPESGFFLLSCSPRAGGNCDTAARLFREGLGAGGRSDLPAIVCLREYRVQGCTGCGACDRYAQSLEADADPYCPPAPFLGCPESLRDDSALLLRRLAKAEELCIIAPIYFYHLPSQLKALVDRCQAFWALRQAGFLPGGKKKKRCRVILAAARNKGEKLFEGSLLSLKYALAPLNISLAEPLLLNGLDAPGDLSATAEHTQKVAAYGRYGPPPGSP